MSPIPYTEKSSLGIPWHTTFVGQRMQHNYWLYSIIDKVMIENPQIESVIEIGTGSGAMSMVFGLWGVRKDIRVFTIDKVLRHNPVMLSKLGVEYMQADVFSEVARQRIQTIIGDKPTWVYCDGGNKRVELQTFAPLIPSGSIISAHDLGVEFFPQAVTPGLIPDVIAPYRQEWWMDLNVQLAMFKKT
jgi:hypothetical protein